MLPGAAERQGVYEKDLGRDNWNGIELYVSSLRVRRRFEEYGG